MKNSTEASEGHLHSPSQLLGYFTLRSRHHLLNHRKNNWLVVYLPLWKIWVEIWVSLDDDIPNIWKVIKFHGSSHHQSETEAFKTARILEVKQLGILQHHCLRSLSNYSSLWIAQGGAIWLLNSLPWKDPPCLRTVNHHKPSISMGHAISHGKLSAITRWYQ